MTQDPNSLNQKTNGFVTKEVTEVPKPASESESGKGFFDDPIGATSEFVDKNITGSAKGLTDSLAKKVDSPALSEKTAKGAIPWLAAGASTLVGVALLKPINWLVGGAFSLVKNVVTLGGLLPQIPVLGKPFEWLGQGIDFVGKYAGLAVPAIAGFIGYKAFQSADSNIDDGKGNDAQAGNERLLGIGGAAGVTALAGRANQRTALENAGRPRVVATASREANLRQRLAALPADGDAASKGQIAKLDKLLGQNNRMRIVESIGKDGVLTAAQADAVLDYAKDARKQAIGDARSGRMLSAVPRPIRDRSKARENWSENGRTSATDHIISAANEAAAGEGSTVANDADIRAKAEADATKKATKVAGRAKFDGHAAGAATVGLTAINAGKAIYYMMNGDGEKAAHYGQAAGTLGAVHTAFHSSTLQNVSVKAAKGTVSKLGNEAMGESVERLLGKLGSAGFKIGGRSVPLVGAGVSLGFSGKAAYDKYERGETGNAISEGAAGIGEAGLGTVTSVVGMGFAGGEVGRELMNGISYLVTAGNHSGDPSLTRLLMSEGKNVAAAWVLPHVERSQLDDQQKIKVRAFTLSNGHEIAIPVLPTESKSPRLPASLRERMNDKELAGYSETGKLYKMMMLAKQEKVSMNPFGGDRYAEVHDTLSAQFTRMEQYEDSARAYMEFAKRFNEVSRPQLIEELKQSGASLNGRDPEEMVPELETGEALGLHNPPKITAVKYPEAYTFLKESVAEGVNVDELTPKQQHHLIREAMPIKAMDMSTWELTFGGKTYDKFKKILEQYSDYMKKEYVPYTEKLQKYEVDIAANEIRTDKLINEFNTVRKREQLRMLAESVEAAKSPDVDMAELEANPEYAALKQRLAVLKGERNPSDFSQLLDNQSFLTHGARSTEMPSDEREKEDKIMNAQADVYMAQLSFIESKIRATSVALDNDIGTGDLGNFVVDSNLPGAVLTGAQKPAPNVGG